MGDAGDADAVLALLDGAVAWLVAQGRTGQWGDQPWSASPERAARIRAVVAGNELLVLEDGGPPVAALVHGPTAPAYVPAAEAPEDYVLLLVSAVRGGGRRLLDESWARARAAGHDRQRVDCYAGDDGRLVGVYEAAGFARTQTFQVAGWPGQLLERRVTLSAGAPSPPGGGAGARPRSAPGAR